MRIPVLHIPFSSSNVYNYNVVKGDGVIRRRSYLRRGRLVYDSCVSSLYQSSPFAICEVLYFCSPKQGRDNEISFVEVRHFVLYVHMCCVFHIGSLTSSQCPLPFKNPAYSGVAGISRHRNNFVGLISTQTYFTLFKANFISFSFVFFHVAPSP